MRSLRPAALPVIVGAIAVLVLHLIGVDSPFAWGWGLLAAAGSLAFGIRMPEDPRADAPRAPTPPEHVGSEVSRLAWAIDARTDTVKEAVTRRVRALLRRRLSRHGVEVDDPAHAAAVAQLLGPQLWPRLTGRRTTLDDIRSALAAAERLAQPTTTAPATRTSPAATKEDAT